MTNEEEKEMQESEEQHRLNDPNYFNDPFDPEDDEEWDEPTGSCDWCGTNVYDGSDLCESCEWHAHMNEGE